MTNKLAHFVQEWKERTVLRQVFLALTLWGVTALLLLPHLGYPRAVVFDETYMIPRAQRYLRGIFFQESHPPLGRLAIFFGQHFIHPELQHDEFALVETIDGTWPVDEDMTGYRIIPALFGTTIPVLVFFILRFILSDDFSAFVISTAVVFDNALLTQAHFALADSILISFCLLSILIFVYLYSDQSKPIRSLWPAWIIWGVVMAAATLVKFTGGFVGILVPIYAVRMLLNGQKRGVLIFAFSFSIAFLITTATVWQIHFSLIPNLDSTNDYEISAPHRQILEGTYDPDPFTRFAIQFRDAIVFMRGYHKGVPKLDLANPDEIGSPWYQWPFGGRTISYRWETPDGGIYRYIYLIGNPTTWFMSLLGVILCTAVTISDTMFSFLPGYRRHWIYIFTLLYWTYMIPMMFIQRVMYLYHYLPPLLIGILMLGIISSELTTIGRSTRRNLMFLSLIMVIISFWVYKPFTFYEPLTTDQFQQRNVWMPWNLECVNCQTK